MIKWRQFHLVELMTADLTGILRLAAERNLEFFQLNQVDEIHHRLKIRPEDYPLLEKLCEKRGSSCRILRRSSPGRMAKWAMERPVLILGILFFAVLTWYLPRRILILEVEGNEQVSRARIFEAAEESGLHFGVSAQDVRSERVKNNLLDMIPELQWVGVNLRGAAAVIQVREREIPPEPEYEAGVGHIVAIRDGVITECTAYRGNQLCRPGEAVTEGQILISGFTDTGLVIRAEQAQGEVYAMTKRSLRLIFPREVTVKTTKEKKFLRISLQIGKKRINLWKNSGISSAICDRMYKEYYVTLPGGFRLPMALAVEIFQTYSPEPGLVSPDQGEKLLEELSEIYLLGAMNAGTICDSSLHFGLTDSEVWMTGEYHCMEMIGKMQRLEIGEKDE